MSYPYVRWAFSLSLPPNLSCRNVTFIAARPTLPSLSCASARNAYRSFVRAHADVDASPILSPRVFPKGWCSTCASASVWAAWEFYGRDNAPPLQCDAFRGPLKYRSTCESSCRLLFRSLAGAVGV